MVRLWLVWEKYVTMLQLQCIVLKLQFESVWPIPLVQAMSIQWVAAKLKKYWTKRNKRFRFQSRKFWPEREKKRLVASPKTKLDPLRNCDSKPLSIKDSAEVNYKVYYITGTQAKVDFVKSLISTTIVQPKKVLSISVSLKYVKIWVPSRKT